MLTWKAGGFYGIAYKPGKETKNLQILWRSRTT